MDQPRDVSTIAETLREASRNLFSAISAAEELNSKLRGSRPTEAGKAPTPSSLSQWADQILAQSEQLCKQLSDQHQAIGVPGAEVGGAQAPGYATRG